jgi:predicted SnoaL-like aldol condensation-catalyzing enzyme
MQTQVGNELARNKRLAKECLDLIFNKHNPEQAVDLYISPNYRQHNPDAPDGPQGILSYAGSYIKANPTMRLEFKRIIAEGDYVVVHSHLIPNHTDIGRAVVDIFRVKDGKLAEHWDVIQPVPRQPKNHNTMF